ncbi:MAG: alpha/beta hydrolase [Planctomycetia bacterium]|nr:alpha/beta hydrolase [Planctomycetia bacterium]
MRTVAFLIAIAVLQASQVAAQEAERQNRAYPPDMPGAKAETYKTVGDTRLKLYVFEPDGWKASDKRPAIVCFFGGGWTSGSPRQFLPQCKYLATRGMVAIAADYRVASRNQVKAVDCVKDAKSAIRFVRTSAARLGVDPNRIVAAGGSAGGHLAAACGTLAGFDEPNEDASISSRPNAMLLFNPAVVLAAIEGVDLDLRRMATLADRLGTNPRDLSPYHHISAGVPPTAIFHGKADQVVPYATVVAFAKAMKDAGNTCELFSYDGEGHGFFNYGRGRNEMFVATLKEADKFLAQLGYLEGEATLEDPAPDVGDL